MDYSLEYITYQQAEDLLGESSKVLLREHPQEAENKDDSTNDGDLSSPQISPDVDVGVDSLILDSCLQLETSAIDQSIASDATSDSLSSPPLLPIDDSQISPCHSHEDETETQLENGAGDLNLNIEGSSKVSESNLDNQVSTISGSDADNEGSKASGYDLDNERSIIYDYCSGNEGSKTSDCALDNEGSIEDQAKICAATVSQETGRMKGIISKMSQQLREEIEASIPGSIAQSEATEHLQKVISESIGLLDDISSTVAHFHAEFEATSTHTCLPKEDSGSIIQETNDATAGEAIMPATLKTLDTEQISLESASAAAPLDQEGEEKAKKKRRRPKKKKNNTPNPDSQDVANPTDNPGVEPFLGTSHLPRHDNSWSPNPTDLERDIGNGSDPQKYETYMSGLVSRYAPVLERLSDFDIKQQQLYMFALVDQSRKHAREVQQQMESIDTDHQSTVTRLKDDLSSLNDAYVKAKADYSNSVEELQQKCDRIKFENRNLKTDRNKELEKVRKDFVHSQEEIVLLKSRLSQLDKVRKEVVHSNSHLEECRRELKISKNKESRHIEELRAIRLYQPDMIADFKDLAIKQSRLLRFNDDVDHDSFLAEVEHNIKKQKYDVPIEILNHPRLSEEGKRLCAIVNTLRKDNILLQTRCQWYWDVYHDEGEAKHDALVSYHAMELSAIEFENQAIGLEEEVKQLKDKVKQLEEDGDLKKPLFEVGVAVRKRFLEHAKPLLYPGEPRGTPNRRSIVKGNEQCHRGNCLADAALYKLGLATEGDGYADGGITFTDLYAVPYTYVWASSPSHFILREACDMEASISSMDGVNDHPSCTRAKELFASIIEKWNLGPQDLFGVDEEVLELVETLRGELRTTMNSARNKRCRGYVEEVDEETGFTTDSVVDPQPPDAGTGGWKKYDWNSNMIRD